MTGVLTTVIFDLGNVVLPFDPLKPCAVKLREGDEKARPASKSGVLAVVCRSSSGSTLQ